MVLLMSIRDMVEQTQKDYGWRRVYCESVRELLNEEPFK